MGPSDTAPEQLSERELFTEYMRILEQESAAGGYSKAKLDERRASLLAEIGERLEALEATKTILYDETDDSQDSTDSEQGDDSMELAFDE